MALSGPRRGAKNGTANALVVFVHGYGADGNDLIGLAAPLADILPDAAFAAPDAPHVCPGARFQWFPIAELNPEVMHKGVVAAAPGLKDYIVAELQRLALPPSRLALIGFSQGTMMALHLGLEAGLGALKPAAIVGFSGVLTGEVQPAADFPPVLLSHGGADPLIPPEALFLTAGTLGAAGVRVQWHLSPGVGHGIDETGLSRAANFLKLALAGRLAAEGECRSLLR
jgi:phospholipase/carboxylesterase